MLITGPQSEGKKSPAGKVERRRAMILDVLSGVPELSVEELLHRLPGSPATLRRDLRVLERRGLVRRRHGAVALAGSVAFEPFMEDPGFREQVRHMAAEKSRIGSAAADLVADGEIIGLAAGTTVAQIARSLRRRQRLTVVTNAVNVAVEFSRSRDITVELTGGQLSGEWFALVGPHALECARSTYIDKFFFGANGVDPERGITDRHTEEAAMNRALLRQAKERILVVDHSKFGVVARHLVCELNEIQRIITDTGATDEVIEPYLRKGIDVLRV